jgi:uncharacterized damage-inducible protein DinB
MKKHIDLIWEYNYWANRRILARAEQLTPAQLAEHAPYMWDSILRTMAHVLGAEWIWRQRVQEGISPTAILDRDAFGTLAQLRQRWDEEDAAMRAYLGPLTDADLDRIVEYKNTAGDPFQRPLWQILAHMVNHGTQHRSEVALSLTNFGFSPGDMDIPVYLAQQEMQQKA